MESLPSPLQVKSSHFIMSSLFLPYSHSFSYKKTDLFGYRGYMLLFLFSFLQREKKGQWRERVRIQRKLSQRGGEEVQSTRKRYTFFWDRWVRSKQEKRKEKKRSKQDGNADEYAGQCWEGYSYVIIPVYLEGNIIYRSWRGGPQLEWQSLGRVTASVCQR